MALAGNALVAIWNDIATEKREDFFEWHPREHMVERLGIPGFLRGRRCIAVDPGTEFLTLYEVRDADVLTSRAYLDRLTNPTPWSTATLPAFRNNVRGACRIEFTEGCAMGGFILTLRLEAEPGREAALVAALRDEVMPRVIRAPRVTGAHFVRNDPALTGGNAGNQRGRVITLPHLVVLVEGSTADGVRAAGEQFRATPRLAPRGARPEVIRELYQLEYSIQSLAG